MFFWQPWLALPRAAYHLLGFIYNFRVLPGRRRLKEMYFFKNAASCAGFLLTLFAYPLVAYGLRGGAGVGYVAFLAAYFALLEVSFEIIYDLRDVRGDRLAKVRSYPVVHGELFSGRLILLLNALSAEALLVGGALGLFAWKEMILIVAPLVQIALFRRGERRGFAPRDCVAITWTFAAMNFGYVLWVLGGLPLALPFAVTLPRLVEFSLVVIALLCLRWLAPLYGARRYALAFAAVVFGSWAAEHTAIAWYDSTLTTRRGRFFSGTCRWPSCSSGRW
ncbi:MAG: UbiA family prenyltransferase [Deltaproteobacteria bacterium]|nr:UbiA family prenyltransferase [Deltaproteobacteria bacterium]